MNLKYYLAERRKEIEDYILKEENEIKRIAFNFALDEIRGMEELLNIRSSSRTEYCSMCNERMKVKRPNEEGKVWICSDCYSESL